MTTQLNIIALPALHDNYIWTIQDTTHARCVVIDPGTAEPVLEFLKKTHYQLEAILITHHHYDHTQGIQQLLPCFNSDPVIFASAKTTIPHKTHALQMGDKIALLQDNLYLNIYEIPGHTKDHIAYYSEHSMHYPALFCGDTLFSGGCGRLMEGTMDQLYHSLLRLRNLPDNTRIYCSHEYTVTNLQFAHWLEPNHLLIRACLQEAQSMRHQKKPTLPSSLQKEKLINPFLKCDDQQFMFNMAKRFGITNPSSLEIFSMIRTIKDKWNGTNVVSKKGFNAVKRIFATLIGVVALSLYTFNILITCTLFCLISLLRFIPFKSCQNSWHRLVAALAPCWVNINTWIQHITIPHTKWIVQSQSGPLEQILHSNHWYLLISNHQSWVDILVLQRVLNRYIPFPKFFFKRELLWTLPFASWICWLLHFPLVYRYSRKQMAQKPELKTRNLEITRHACESYKNFPTTVANFVEGTRFSTLKHRLQASPYEHLLKPQTGGIALSIAILHQHLDKILNITICYNSKKISFWHFLCGDIPSITVYIEALPITSELVGDYQHDRTFRMHIQQWLNHIWLKKDQLIQKHILSTYDTSS